MQVKGLYDLLDLLLSMGHEFFAVAVQATYTKDAAWQGPKVAEADYRALESQGGCKEQQC